MANEKTKASEEQMAYAKILNIGMWFGLALLVITFFVYISGVLPTFVPINDLPKYWTMRVHDFNHELHAPTGWGWTALAGKTHIGKDALASEAMAILNQHRLPQLRAHRDPGRTYDPVLPGDPPDSRSEEGHSLCRYRDRRSAGPGACGKRAPESRRPLIPARPTLIASTAENSGVRGLLKPFGGKMIREKVACTSSAVKSAPSWNCTP